MSSLLPTIEAKSDQLNADDLLGGPRNITITGVKVNTSDDQPVWVHFEGDNNKPYKPCKTMRKVLVQVWGDDSRNYTGRSLTIYNDPNVKFGGMSVGGIRISHASHIDKPRTFFLTATRGKKAEHTVKPLVIQQPRQEVSDEELAGKIIAAVKGRETIDALNGLTGTDKAKGAIAHLKAASPELAAQVEAAIGAKAEELRAMSQGDWDAA